jgi:hypothetical protein
METFLWFSYEPNERVGKNPLQILSSKFPLKFLQSKGGQIDDCSNLSIVNGLLWIEGILEENFPPKFLKSKGGQAWWHSFFISSLNSVGFFFPFWYITTW